MDKKELQKRAIKIALMHPTKSEDPVKLSNDILELVAEVLQDKERI